MYFSLTFPSVFMSLNYECIVSMKQCCSRVNVKSAWMLRPRGLCGLEAKLFGLGLVVSGLSLGLVASGLGLIEVGLVASKFAAYMD